MSSCDLRTYCCLLWFCNSWRRCNSPLYKTNVTVYHVNPSTYGSTPINMNTGNAAGDMFFWAKSVATPIECAANSTRAGMSGFDCKNAEVTSSNLAVTKLVLEIDNRFTGYSMCNICVDGRDPLSHRSGHNCSMVPLPQCACMQTSIACRVR
eukprot:SAG31_NODE_1986_length_6725_cov_3.779505_7_plen_152_part_00